VDEEDKDKATNHVNEMCRKLLANPVIENYRFELEQVRAA
jgi:phosphoribosylformylglycinamidine synthase PurS subunit